MFILFISKIIINIYFYIYFQIQQFFIIYIFQFYNCYFINYSIFYIQILFHFFIKILFLIKTLQSKYFIYIFIKLYFIQKIYILQKIKLNLFLIYKFNSIFIYNIIIFNIIKIKKKVKKQQNLKFYKKKKKLQMEEVQYIIGAIKIKDGLFIGDQESISDLEFILSNKVTHIINTSGKQIPNTWENIGIQYLTLFWKESDKQVNNYIKKIQQKKILFDSNQKTARQILEFIEKANKQGDSCLVHSVRGQSRACCALTVYFMLKYKWTLFKTLDYLNSRRPDLEIRATFFHQLQEFEAQIIQSGLGKFSGNWNQEELIEHFENEEDYKDAILLRNTYLNSKNINLTNNFNLYNAVQNQKQKKIKKFFGRTKFCFKKNKIKLQEKHHQLHKKEILNKKIKFNLILYQKVQIKFLIKIMGNKQLQMINNKNQVQKIEMNLIKARLKISDYNNYSNNNNNNNNNINNNNNNNKLKLIKLMEILLI
ncbi:hypothetical protein IMG5_172640 [Ichthyophthirius multifiliis]|uniref:Tyrosine-protein phosphatase domain-containing protein n=1 Tax=Ichthyophthirius multifiliis TaxID=5932 RepID=G0R1T8_ICHMU|nr:hypothetical protein IMG5_172640 [Ichthyophthirius multifiliis]EGR28590.1 hypothetical protein IMG5_172640 [Ichthyophthirius multifiliis]|eukprot:XP_004029826.1 hypothetical protein IMG5_172640 [Ichthyophthirius multifiliis]